MNAPKPTDRISVTVHREALLELFAGSNYGADETAEVARCVALNVISQSRALFELLSFTDIDPDGSKALRTFFFHQSKQLEAAEKLVAVLESAEAREKREAAE